VAMPPTEKGKQRKAVEIRKKGRKKREWIVVGKTLFKGKKRWNIDDCARKSRLGGQKDALPGKKKKGGVRRIAALRRSQRKTQVMPASTSP